MSAIPRLEPSHAGGMIVAVAVVLVVSLVAIVVGQDRPVRPDLSAVPLPEGSVTHAAVETCSGDGPQVCTVDLAVGPAGGVELPRETEVMLAEHLREQGWGPQEPLSEGGTRGELVSPDGRLVVRVSDYDTDDVPQGLDSDVDEDVAREDLASLRVSPRDHPAGGGS